MIIDLFCRVMVEYRMVSDETLLPTRLDESSHITLRSHISYYRIANTSLF